MTSEERFKRLSTTLLRNPGVSLSSAAAGSKRSFGSRGQLKVNNKIFAFVSKGRLVVKLSRQRVDALVAVGEAERFDPGHGRLMKEWLALKARVRIGLAASGERSDGVRGLKQ